MAEYTKPLPSPTVETLPFWNYCKQHELRMQKCLDCGYIRFPVGGFCPNCLSDKAEWLKMSGKGTVYTFGVTHYVYDKGFAGSVPYAIAVIELAEGPRLMGNVTGCDLKNIKVGMSVEVYFEDIDEEFALPKWKPRA